MCDQRNQGRGQVIARGMLAGGSASANSRHERRSVSINRKLSETAILAVLALRPGEPHTHWFIATNMPRVYDPGWPDAPEKLLLARLRAMVRKGLVTGCGCGCRGDWSVATDAFA